MIFNFSGRKRRVLEAIVSDYIDTAEPVGSSTVTHQYFKEFSPATIRAEMAELEQLGFITHPYTSSGRIPTDRGYRYYVDNIVETKIVSGKEIALIKNGIKKIGRGFEDIFRGTAKLISSMMDYVAVFVSFSKDKTRIYSSGLSNILKQPEFTDISSARRVIGAIEQDDFLARILEEYANKQKARQDLCVFIGHENKYRGMQDLSIAVTRHHFANCDPGAIGIIGPTRMDYVKVKSILEFLNQDGIYD